jgi:hypothetical protein
VRAVFPAAVMFFAGLMAVSDPETAGAHPPESKPNVPASGQAGEPQEKEPANPVAEADRQVAYFQFESLSWLASRCPSPLQRETIQQALAELQTATQLPQAPSLKTLVAERTSLQAKLREQHRVVSLEWSKSGLKPAMDCPAIDVAGGLSRVVIVDILNTDSEAANLTLAIEGQNQNAVPWTVLPGESQWFPIMLTADLPAIAVTVTATAGEVTHRFSLPIKVTEPAKIRGRMFDGDRGKATPGRVWVEGSNHQYRLAGPFAANKSFLEKPILLSTVPRSYGVPFFYADGTFEIDVPPGRTVVTLERGFEHSLASETIDLAAGETRELTLSSKRFVDMKSQGWVSGDTHIHWVTNAWNVDLPLEHLSLVQKAEDLQVVNNLTLLHRTAVDAFVKPSQAPMGPIRNFCSDDYHIEMAEEYRNQNLYGHLCFLNLKWLVLPIGTGPQIAGDDSLDYPINKTAILQAREQGGISIEAHGVGANHELPLNAVHGLTDSLDQIDPDDYYRLLDCGFQLPLTNGSDHPARIAGCARAYVKMEGEFVYEKWIDGIRRGRTFTTSGPLLSLTVNNRNVGEVLTTRANETLQIQVTAKSRFPLGKVQILSNGVVLKELETQDEEADLNITMPAGESRWIVARCSRNDQWNSIWHPDIAHTSAVYVHVDGRSVFRDEAAHEWIDRMRLHIRDIQTKGLFGNAAQRNEALAYAGESIRRYERLMAIRSQSPQQGMATIDEQRDLVLMQASFVSPLSHDDPFLNAIRESVHTGNLRNAAEPLTILKVQINPESRVKLAPVTLPESLVQHRTQRFLVEIHNEARIQSPLRIRTFDQSSGSIQPADWCDVQLMENLFSSSILSGEETEWKLLELRCDLAGRREVRFEADVGQGTQDLGFRATTDVLLKVEASGPSAGTR